MKTKLVYFARAIDGIKSDDIRLQSSEVEKELSSYGFRMIDPFIEDKFDNNITFENRAKEIVERDLAILKTVDAVLMDCSIPGRSYVGCICELVYAHCWAIPTIVYVGTSGNNARYWLQYHATVVCMTRKEAIYALVSIFK